MLKRSKRLRKRLHRILFPYYRATSFLRPLPNSVIIGAMKCGTTTLNAWLRHHPDVAFSAVKEVHFFDNNYHRGLGWYRSYFPLLESLSGPRCVLEATPAYIQHAALVAERMHEHIPEARLILMLRDPVRRAISHYGHRISNGLEKRPIEEALLSEGGWEPGSRNFYKTRGLYAEKLSAFLRYYDRSQVLVLKSEEFFAQPAEVYGLVQSFLGLTHVPLPEDMKARNVGRKRHDVPGAVLDHLTEFYAEPNRQLGKLLPDFDVWA
jgi:lipopolysaccharide transport system ATP-binding protein